MKCKDFRKILQEYSDKTLSKDEAASLESHLAHCKECSGAYAEVENISLIVRSLDKKQAKPGFESAVIAKIKNNDYSLGLSEAFFKTARVSFIAGVFVFTAFAAFSFFTPSASKVDNIEALNYYVMKDTVAEKGVKDILLG